MSAAPAHRRGSYGAGARVLSIGLATTGLVTFAYFSLASYALGDQAYKGISILWSITFVVVSVIHRPIEQLLSRTIASRRARGLEGGHPLRTPLTLQAAFALAFVGGAVVLREVLVDGAFDGEESLYWILLAGVLFYGASYFARGWLAGHQWFVAYGALVFMESSSRCLFALAAAVGLVHGQLAVALGIAAAPLVSLVVVPLVAARRPPAEPPRGGAADDGLELGRGGRFAAAVLAVMLAEQILLNGGVLAAEISAPGTPVAGYVFNVLLIVRAPLQLFQAVQGSLLPHLTGLSEGETAGGEPAGGDEFRRAVRVTVLAIAAFSAAVALGLLTIGPWALGILFEDRATYDRLGLAAVGLGMGAHLVAGTLSQAALARERAGPAAAVWLLAAAGFVAWMLVPVVRDELLRAEVGYLGAALALCAGLAAVYRRTLTPS